MSNVVSSSWLSGLIPGLMGVLTPEIQRIVENGIKDWWERAKKTENPWDNYAVSLAAGVLGIKLKG